MYASLPQLLTFPAPMPILPPATAVYADASRSKLNLLGIRRNGKKKSRRSSYGESIFVH
jgi:hypothetical protein